MKFNLLDYMSNRVEGSHAKRETGPVLTISRQFGCSAKSIAKALTEELNRLYPEKKQWEWVNKEIFEGVAKELEVSKERILHVFEGERKEFIWDVFRGFSEKYYKSDATIRAKLKDLISDIAFEGNKIIIGLGSVAVLREHPLSLHIRLIAPQKWRLEQAGQKMDVSSYELKNYMETVDKKRDNLLNSYSGIKQKEDIFDITFNVANLTQEEMIASIIRIMELRQIV